MEEKRTALSEKIKTSNNVLVTVPKNPTPDQLAAALGLTLIVNKLGKHGSAVFSGAIPSTLEFLKPEETIEKNTDSLRDFIISLDRNKADKLRYKVEDEVVKIYITPYRTSIGEEDLIFSQGDFNVDLIIGLGVIDQNDLDDAISAHGRILHDATIACVNIDKESSFGSINLLDNHASSLCELVYIVTKTLVGDKLDSQIATALLTGIVAETDRFSNEKTSSRVMTISGELISAGANQQLVASSMHEDASKMAENKKPEDAATLNISHDKEEKEEKLPEPLVSVPTISDIEKMEEEKLEKVEAIPKAPAVSEPPIPSYPGRDPDLFVGPDSKFITEPPQNSGRLTANSQPEGYDPSTDPLSNITMPSTEGDGIIDKPKKIIQPDQNFTPPPEGWTAPSQPDQSPPPVIPNPTETLSQIEQDVNSEHSQQQDELAKARSLVDDISNQAPNGDMNEPIAALNAMPAIENINGSKEDDINTQTDILQPTDQNVQQETPPPVPPPMLDYPQNNIPPSDQK